MMQEEQRQAVVATEIFAALRRAVQVARELDESYRQAEAVGDWESCDQLLGRSPAIRTALRAALAPDAVDVHDTPGALSAPNFSDVSPTLWAQGALRRALRVARRLDDHTATQASFATAPGVDVRDALREALRGGIV